MPWDPNYKNSSAVFTENNTKVTSNGARGDKYYSNGKRYFEIKIVSTACTSSSQNGVMLGFQNNVTWTTGTAGYVQPNNQLLYGYGSGFGAPTYAHSMTKLTGDYFAIPAGSIVGFALDMDGNKLYVYKDNVQKISFSFTRASNYFFPLCAYGVTTVYQLFENNFNMTVPTGYTGWAEIPNKFLFEQNSIIKTWNGTLFIDIGSSPVTKTMFDDNGITSLSSINYKLLSSDNSNIKLLTYNSNGTIITKNITPTIVNNQKIVVSNDVSISELLSIDSMTLTGSNIKVFISSNSGDEWFTYNNNTWILYPLTRENLTTYGMTTTIFNSINTNFNSLITRDKFKLAFLVDSNFSVNTLAYQLDLKGVYESGANIITKYNIIYGSNNSIKIKLLEPGTFKINY